MQALQGQALHAKLSALSNKETSDEGDLPLASEGEVEHEEDSLDVELWRNKLVAWETTEVVRKTRMRGENFVGKLQAPKFVVPAGGRGHDH